MFKVIKKHRSILLLLVLGFILLRFSGLDLPYHQDENKWIGITMAGIPHPPLTGVFLVSANWFFGSEHLRFLPFILGIINLLLLYWLVNYKYGKIEAIWSSLFFIVSFYSVLASLMVDTDGQVLPLFFLLSASTYYKWRDCFDFKKRLGWGILLLFFVLAGFLVKLSFVIALGALALDFLYSQKNKISRKLMIKCLGVLFALAFFLTFLFFIARHIIPTFDLSRSFAHWKVFFALSDRNFLQTGIQFFKAVMYASPLLVAPLLFLTKDLAKKLSFFIFFLVLGLIFYLLLFDFSSGALDRYFQFMIVPLSVISGVVMTHILQSAGGQIWEKSRRFIILGLLISAGVFFLQFVPHFVPSLWPKTEWFNRALSFKWNFVFPFTGGSGPLGFYISWLFMAVVWLLSLSLTIMAFLKSQWRKPIWVLILILGLTYNAVFIEEYLFGKINGNPNYLLEKTLVFIENNNDIKKVINYNNIGLYKLTKIGKFERRLYVAPKHEAVYAEELPKFKGHFMVIDMPRLDPNGPYAKYFSSCGVVYEAYSQKISSKVYDCRKVTYSP
ncbi:MAG: hypothetical protein G01um101444_173 [Parcubacteria group bacterium Gr01-1014_44]|nr:MAG: hypothetical protein G01um101444_173 [Parcubacteria group bacterium Gr01-1014_44]